MSVTRRRRSLFPFVIAGFLLAGTAGHATCNSPALPPSGNALLRELCLRLERMHDEAQVRSLLQNVGLKLEATFSEREAREGRRAFLLTFTRPFPVRHLIADFGWERPYAVSGDMHQTGWSLRLWTGDIDGREDTRIASHTPHVGAWAVDPSLDGRPAGELPKLMSGGSPAYDLLREYDANVTSIGFELWSDGWQVPDHMEKPQGDEAPRFAFDDALIRGWIEKHQGYGQPQYFDSGTGATDMRVFAAWNIPYSGVNTTDFWVYCLAPTGGWTLLESGDFQPPADQAHDAFLDREAAELRFLGRDRKVYHRVPVGACKWKRP